MHTSNSFRRRAWLAALLSAGLLGLSAPVVQAGSARTMTPVTPPGMGQLGRGGPGGRDPLSRATRTTADEDDLIELMTKAIHPDFKEDVFTFARLIYSSSGGGFGRRFWDDDTPDADLNLGFRLYQVTSLKVHPGFKYITITPENLAAHPFVYLAATAGMNLTNEEVRYLHTYMTNGGFVMAEDFWGDSQWAHVFAEVKRIFPDREIVELPLSHPIFHQVFEFRYRPQMPSVGIFLRTGQAYDPADYTTDHDPHYYAVSDDKGRMMMLICRNNHYGDGWEHEGDDHRYFDLFSEPQAYPMMINILFYTMTH